MKSTSTKSNFFEKKNNCKVEKTNRQFSVIYAAAVFLLAIMASSLQKANAQIALKFATNCTKVSGTDKALNAKYLYTLVNDSLDCIVTIADIEGGAVIYSVDNNTITGTGGYGGNVNRFQPIISVPKATNNTSYVKFHFQLIKKGTYNSSTGAGTNVIPSHMLWLRAYDIDGNGDNNSVKEFVETSSSFVGAWPDETTSLVAKTPIMTGGQSYSIATSATNGNNISDVANLTYNAFLYQNTTGAWDVIGGSYVGSTLPSITNGFDDGDRLNSWDFNFPAITPGADFGDGPYSYEFVSGVANPAYHIVSATASNVKVFLGSNKPDVDYDPIGSAAANSDDANGADNGITITGNTKFTYTKGSFSTTITATNTSGANAYIYGWIDFNENGIFDAAEKSTVVTVPTGGSSPQTFTITFSGAFTNVTTSTTKIGRFRIGSVPTEVSSPNGKASNGEVEDYAMPFTYTVLPVSDLNLSANQQSGSIKLTLVAKGEERVSHYDWQQSTDGVSYATLGSSPYQTNTSSSNTYLFSASPSVAASVEYYRVVEYDLDGNSTISNIVALKFNDNSSQAYAMPTLITDYTNIKLQANTAGNVTLRVMNSEGKMVMSKLVPLAAGSNTFAVDGWSKFANGTYYIQVVGSSNQSMLKVVVQH